MAEDIIRREENVDVEGIGSRISDDIGQIIEHSKHAVAVYLNTEVTLTYWRIGRCIANELDANSDEKYGSKIVSTVSRQLTERYGNHVLLFRTSPVPFTLEGAPPLPVFPLLRRGKN